jgi:tetratricopeptide (TPR) repeat protein
MYRLLAAGFLVAGLLYGQTPEDLEAAVKSDREFLAHHPNEVAVRSNLGVALSRLGRFDEAIAEYKKALDVDPENGTLALNLGLAYYKSGRVHEAAKEFSQARQAASENQQITLLLADCDLQMGQNDRVVALLRPIEQQNPNDLAIAYLLGTALIRDHRVEEGQKRVDRILRNGDSPEARFLLGSQMFEAGDFPSALKQFSRAIELNPTLPALQSFYGQALLNTGDPDAAAAAFQKELASNPTDFAANLYLAEIFIQRKKWSEAEPLLTRALQVRPESAAAKQDLAKAHRREELSSDPGAKGPQPGEEAPEFIATDTISGKQLTLRELRKAGPVVLVFGSYTCPNFRAAAGTLNALYAVYKGQAGFYLIYIREAHSTADWQSTRNQREGVVLAPASSMSERQDHATLCMRKLHLEFPSLLDNMTGAAEKAYSAWPSKAFVIDRQGRIVFGTSLRELDFKPDRLRAAIENVSASVETSQALVQDAIAKQRAGDLDIAIKEYREFLKTHPEAAIIHSNLGAALAGLGRFEEAVAEYKTALKQSPHLPGVSLNLALAHYKMGRIGEAAAELVKLHAETPTNNQATLLLADCYLRMGRNKDVTKLVQPIQRDNPDDMAIAYLLGTALIRDNQVEQGQTLVDRILRNGESAEAHLMLGSAKIQVKDFSGARDEFAKAVALNPNIPEVHALYAQALQLTGDPAGALEQFKAELAINPYNFDSNLEMGVLLRQDEKLDDALFYLHRALNVRPGDMGVRYQIAAIALSQGKIDQARGELESMVKEAPQFTEAHVSLATVYYRMKRPEDGNRERGIVRKLIAEAQAKQPGVKTQ